MDDAKVKKRIAEIEREIEIKAAVLAELRGFLGRGEVSRQSADKVFLSLNARSDPGPSLRQKIIDLMRETAKPMRAAEITRKLTQAGVTTAAKSGLGPVVSSALCHGKDLFEWVSRGRYRLKAKGGEGDAS